MIGSDISRFLLLDYCLKCLTKSGLDFLELCIFFAAQDVLNQANFDLAYIKFLRRCSSFLIVPSQPWLVEIPVELSSFSAFVQLIRCPSVRNLFFSKISSST